MDGCIKKNAKRVLIGGHIISYDRELPKTIMVFHVRVISNKAMGILQLSFSVGGGQEQRRHHLHCQLAIQFWSSPCRHARQWMNQFNRKVITKLQIRIFSPSPVMKITSHTQPLLRLSTGLHPLHKNPNSLMDFFFFFSYHSFFFYVYRNGSCIQCVF